MDDGDGLENRSGCKLTGGSNPSPSAKDVGLGQCLVPAQLRATTRVRPYNRNILIINNETDLLGEMPEWSIGAAC